VVPTVPTVPVTGPPLLTNILSISSTDLLSFVNFLFDLDDKYDSYDRFNNAWEGSTLGYLDSLGYFFDTLFHAEKDEDRVRVEGDEILEESDGGLFGLFQQEESEEEKKEREKDAAQGQNLQNAMYGQAWIFNPGTNVYSSYRVFGFDPTRLSR
jgi:hypothetical protein